MKARHQRALFIALSLALLGGAVWLLLSVFQKNLVFFYSPTQLLAGEAPAQRRIRIGGLVEDGSLQRDADGLTLRFVVTDLAQRVPVVYRGALPDLFREGKGVVAQGRLDDSASSGSPRFLADEVLAKHDENYMPPEAAQALKQAGGKPATLQAGAEAPATPTP